MNQLAPEDILPGQVQRFLEQNQDVAFSFSGATGDLEVTGFAARETINAPYEIEVDLASGDPDIDLHALMDAPACLGIYNKYDEPRFLHGIVTEIERGDSGTRRTFYKAVLRPVLSHLDHGSDSRIWQSKSVPDIVAEIFEEYGVTDVEWRLQGGHAAREYCTQYRETHRAFIERLLAEEGILYFFEHSEKGHKMILTDAPLAAPMLPGAETIKYNSRSGGQSRGSWISAFAQRERLRSSLYEMNDYTFKNPSANQRRRHVGQDNNGLKSDYALYDYPGRYKDARVGDPFTKSRIESVRVDATTGHGTTNNIRLSPGFHFELSGHDDGKANVRHRILSVLHKGTQTTALEEDASGDATTYEAIFTTMPGHLPYRPPLAHKPMVDGPQIGIVTGPEGEEIYCDEFGRIKVWFPWDRRGEQNEHSSCWIRVSQNWAGGSWGHMAIPRIGHEVIVDYLEGDPDQPIVTGRTYHATNRPPYGLPANKTRMTIKSQTHKGEGYNELRFEDEAGREEVFMHAQKDHNTIIENDENHQIGHDRTKRVVNDQSENIGRDKTTTVGNDHKETIKNDVIYQVGRNQQETYGKDHLHSVGNIHKQSITADHLYETGRNYEGTVAGEYKLDVGKSITNNTAKHTLMAFEKFEIKGPGGKITVDSSGITMEAAQINLKGNVSMGGSGSSQVPTLSMAANEGLPICEECAKKATEGS